jgi:hypothetical protein
MAAPAVVEDDGQTTNIAEVTEDFPSPPAPVRTRTLPAQAMPSTESQTHPALPVDAPAALPGSPASASVPPSKPSVTVPRRAPSGLISILLLIALLLVVGGAGVLLANGKLPYFNGSPTATSAATATSAPTVTPPSNLSVYTDSSNVFSVGYPTDWLRTIQNVSAAQRLVIFSNPTTGANFNVGTFATSDVPAQEVADSTLATLAQKTGIANRSGPTTDFIAGQTWSQESGDVTVQQNGKLTAMHAIALATIRGGNTIYVLELAPVNTFSTSEPIFQQMLNSFDFLS